MNTNSSNMDISKYLSEFTNFVLTKYSINGIEEAYYILYNDILKLNKICENIVYEVRISNKQFTRKEMLIFAQLLEFKDNLNILCKKWDEKSWDWTFRYIGNLDLENLNKHNVILDMIEVNGKYQHIMYYRDLTDLFIGKENFFMDTLKLADYN